MTPINNSMAFDPVLALVANNFLQQDLDFFTSLREAGIAEEDFNDYTVNDQGEIVSSSAARPEAGTNSTQDTFAGNGYGFEYDEDGELIPATDPFTPDSFDPNAVTPDSDPALDTGRFATATADDIAPVRQPQPPLGLTYQYNDVDGYDIFDADGNYITTVNDEAQAILYIQNAELDSVGFAAEQNETLNQETLARAAQQADGSATQAALQRAQEQATIQQRYNQTTQGDWRVIIRLAPEADYLYKDTANTLLKPLFDSDGVIFPYTPTITTAYVARYDPYELVHANYRGFFYRNSHVSDLQINGTFTAQDTAEASYLLAVIHFFRSCTKMFYGQDQYRGTPPPVVELSGYGQYQFNNHPCLVSNFNYTLPNGVDYIRVTPNNQGLNLQPRRNPISAGSSVTISSVINRLSNAGLPKGAESGRLDLGTVAGTVNGTTQDTYVPTKIEIQLTLLPVQTRKQVSQLYSTKEFANGNLLRGGFW